MVPYRHGAPHTDPEAIPLLPRQPAVGDPQDAPPLPERAAQPEAKKKRHVPRRTFVKTPFVGYELKTIPPEHHTWYERIKRALRSPGFREAIQAKEEKLGGQVRYHSSPLYDGQLLMFWVKAIPGDAGVAANWTCELPLEPKLTRNPFARNGSLIAFSQAFNPDRWGGFRLPLTTPAIQEAKAIAIPILQAYNDYQQDIARAKASREAANGRSRAKVPCDQYRMIGIPLMVRRSTGDSASVRKTVVFGHHNLETVPHVGPTTFVQKMLQDVELGVSGKPNLNKKMARFYSSADARKSDAIMQGAGYLQENHIVVIDRKSVDINTGLKNFDKAPRTPSESAPTYREGQLPWCRLVVQSGHTTKVVGVRADSMALREDGNRGLAKWRAMLNHQAEEDIKSFLTFILKHYNKHHPELRSPDANGYVHEFTEIETSLEIERVSSERPAFLPHSNNEVLSLKAGPSLRALIEQVRDRSLPAHTKKAALAKICKPITLHKSAPLANYATRQPVGNVIQRLANPGPARVPASTGMANA